MLYPKDEGLINGVLVFRILKKTTTTSLIFLTTLLLISGCSPLVNNLSQDQKQDKTVAPKPKKTWVFEDEAEIDFNDPRLRFEDDQR